MSVRTTSQGHPGHPAGDLGREPCATPRRREEASAERASTERVDESACDGPGASGQRTDRARLIVDHIEAIYALIYAGVGNRVEAEELTSRVFDLAAPCLGRCCDGPRPARHGLPKHEHDPNGGYSVAHARSARRSHPPAAARPRARGTDVSLSAEPECPRDRGHAAGDGRRGQGAGLPRPQAGGGARTDHVVAPRRRSTRGATWSSARGQALSVRPCIGAAAHLLATRYGSRWAHNSPATTLTAVRSAPVRPCTCLGMRALRNLQKRVECF